MILGVTLVTWVIRFLGPENFGKISYTQGLVDIFAPLAVLGINEVLTREIIRYHHLKYPLLGTALVLKLGATCLTCVLIATTTFCIGHTQEENIFIALFSLILFFKIYSVFESYLAAKVLFKYAVYSKLIALFLCSLVRIFLVLHHFPLLYFVLAIILDCVIVSIVMACFYFCQEKQNHRWEFDPGIAKKLLKNGWPYLFVEIIESLYIRIDQIMLKWMTGIEAVGLYSAAVRLSIPCFAIPHLVQSSLFPAIINAKETSRKEFLFRVQRLHDIVLGLFLCFCIPLVIFSHEIISFLYGENFKTSGDILAVHILCGFTIVTVAVRKSWALSENLQHYELLSHIMGVILNIIANFIFIQLYGTMGAAYGTLFASITTFFLTALLIKKMRPSFFMTLRSFFNVLTFQFLRKKYFRPT